MVVLEHYLAIKEVLLSDAAIVNGLNQNRAGQEPQNDTLKMAEGIIELSNSSTQKLADACENQQDNKPAYNNYLPVLAIVLSLIALLLFLLK